MSIPDRISTTHPLRRLEGQCLGPYRLHLELMPGRLAGQTEFTVRLETQDSLSEVVLSGLHGVTEVPTSRGNVTRGILDIQIVPQVRFPAPEGEAVSVADTPLEADLMRQVCQTVDGLWGAMMYLAYGWVTLKQIQELGHPYQVTAEGCLLLSHDFRGGWKDYYYSEGWWEGPIKLKAERPPSAEYRRAWDEQNARDLLAFLAQDPGDGRIQVVEEGTKRLREIPVVVIERQARSRALKVLPTLTLTARRLREVLRHAESIYPGSSVVRTAERKALTDWARRLRARSSRSIRREC